ncbi:MAG: T9SS type A sorting domain-containing protein, partial [Bacteroidales bacterium]|jgi:hypothetical protein|nr:T9SS type A sorting domain-containing protein [Bacteroidales bacterium]
VQVLPAGAGTVSGVGRYEHNEQVTLVANENTGYSFTGWEDALGNPVDIAATLRFNIVSDTLFIARFTPNIYEITIAANSVNGTVSFDGITYSSSAIKLEVPYNTEIPLYSNIVTDKYKFTGWKKLGSPEVVSAKDTFFYTVTNDEYLLATFSNTAVYLSASAAPSNAGTINGNGNYEKGSWYPLTAVSSYGYHFKEWQTLDGEFISDESPLMVYASVDTSFLAVMEKDSFDVGIVSSGFGHTDGGGRYCYRDSAELFAHVSDGYHFVGWYLGDILLGTDTSIKIEVDKSYSITACFDSNVAQLTVLSTHPYNSVVSPSRETKYSRTETLYATAGEGVHFVGWKHNDDTVSSNPVEWLVTADNDTLTALFDTNIHQFTFTNVTPLKGSIELIFDEDTLHNVSEITRELYYNASVKMVATPNYGYHFTGAKDTMFFVITRDTNISVKFSENSITILSSCDPTRGYTSVAGGASHLYGSSVTAEATPYNGYRFVKWVLAWDTSSVFSTYPAVSFTAMSDTSIIAYFEKENYDLTVEVDNDVAGTVMFNGEKSVQINTVIPFDSAITVYAQPLNGYRFSHWLDGSTVVSEDTFYDAVITRQTTLTAVFEANLYEISLSVNSDICGDVAGGGMYPYGSVVNIRAFPYTDYFFNKWVSASDGEFVSFDTAYSFVITGDMAFTAVFRTDTFNIIADAASGDGIASGGGRFLLKQEVTLQAEANYGYMFLEWRNDSAVAVSTDNPYTFEAIKDISLYAVFVPQVFNVEITTNAGSGADIRGMGNYRYGDNAYLFALSDDIYTFNHWELTDSAVFTAEELLNNMLLYSVEKDLKIRAVYQTRAYNVTSSISPVASGSVFNTGVYVHGSAFTLEATPAEHYHFVHWLLDGAIVSTERSLRVDSVHSDLEFIAVFELNRYTLVLSCYPSAGGTLNGGGMYSYGDTATLSVTLNSGYTLNVWRDETFANISDALSFKYVVTKDSYITAALVKDASANEPVSGVGGVRIKVYPNPVSSGDVFNVDVLDGGGATLTLYDLTGRQVLKTNSNPISVAGVPQGIYLLRVVFSNGAVASEKLIVR